MTTTHTMCVAAGLLLACVNAQAQPSPQPAAVLDRYIAAVHAGDMAAVRALIAPEVERSDFPGCTPSMDNPSCLAHYIDATVVWPQARLSLLSTEVDGDRVSALLEVRSELYRRAGVERIVGRDVLRVTDGRIQSFHFVPDFSDAPTAVFFGTLGIGPRASQAPQSDPMFKYFPTNYVWNLSVDLAIEMGARIGEIEEMCAPLQEAAKAPDAAGTQAFRETWVRMADKLCGLAEEDEARGWLYSAGEKYRRASSYLITAERLQAHSAPGRLAIYERELELFLKGSRLLGDRVQRVEIPYEGKHLSALYYPAHGLKSGERAPLLVQLNGLDSTKEMKYLVGLPAWLAQRGVSSLVVDQPGTGEALRLHGLTARYDTEHWASRVVDWLEQHPDVDPKRIGCEGVSLGGYYCPRAVAMEPRFACGVAWGANHDWRDVQKRRLEKEGDFPVPHYWAHVCWVWGAKDVDEFMHIAENVHLDGVVEKIKVPFLVTHGERDSQIPLKWAHRTYEQLVNSPKRELKIFTDREGGVQHASFDNSINAGHYIADWVAQILGGHTA